MSGRVVSLGLVADPDGWRVVALLDGKLSRYEPPHETAEQAREWLETVRDLWHETLAEQGLRFTERAYDVPEHDDEGDT